MRGQEELIILRFEMQMCFLGYRSRARSWAARRSTMEGHRAHEFLAMEYMGHWNDLAAYAAKRFNECIKDVITDKLEPQFS